MSFLLLFVVVEHTPIFDSLYTLPILREPFTGGPFNILHSLKALKQ